MQIKNSPIYLPALENVIDRCPLMVNPQTPLVEVIILMSQMRSTCLVTSFHPSSEVSMMGEARASCVLVVEGLKILGIFTEKDLVRLIASGKVGNQQSNRMAEICISEVMTTQVVVLTQSPDQDIFTALLLLRQHRIRHLPIVDQKGLLIGVVTPESIRHALLQPANLLQGRSVEEVMNSRVITAPTNASVLSIAKMIAEHGVSCVVIIQPQAAEDERSVNTENRIGKLSIPVGMITERDIVQFQALEVDLSQLQAEMVMSSPLFCLCPTDTLWDAHQQMQERYVRRLVVCSPTGELIGIVTQTSLLRVLDPMEMSGVIEVLQQAVEKRTSELKEAIASLSLANTQLENEISSRERAEERLRLLESVVVNANDAIVIMDGGKDDISNPNILYVNEAFTQMTGYTSAEIVGKTPSILRGPATDPVQISKIRQALSARSPLRVEIINYRCDGSEYWVELNSVPVTNEQGEFTHWVSVQRDITQRKLMEQALFEEKELAQVTLQSIGDAVITTDAIGNISYLNPVAEKLTGWAPEMAIGLPLIRVFRIVNEITREPIENTVELTWGEGKIVDLVNNSVLIARNGHEFAIDHSAAPIHASDGRIVGSVLVFRDSTHTRALARQLSWQASHDALTGLVNRREFESCLNEAVQNAKDQNQQHILCYLDLDRFKIVNDTCGHVAGDELLRQVTVLFKNRVRKTDLLARLGGDEFGLLLYQCQLEQGVQVANTLLQSIQSFRFVWQDKTFTIGVSIGVVVIDENIDNPDSVLIAADAACYVAKDKGRNRVYITPVNDYEFAKQQGEMQWVVRINQALEEDRFCLYYQPIIPITAPEINRIHYEVLLRLKGENNQIISPMAFIPAAERYHLMHTIDRWVIRKLFTMKHEELSYKKQENSSQFPNLKLPSYAINLSGASINDDQFIDFLYEQFSLYKIPPEMICFEITETVAIANLTKASELIRSLKEFGCHFALDDFGSGMSSFAYLKNLPVDYLKIDGSFVKNIVNNPIDLAMIDAINKIGHVMGIQTIAEFVENETIFEKIKEVGVDYGQGYGLAEPCPLNANEFPFQGDFCQIYSLKIAS